MSDSRADKIGCLVGAIVGGGFGLFGIVAVLMGAYKLMAKEGKAGLFFGLLMLAILLLALSGFMPLIRFIVWRLRTKSLLEKGEPAVATVLEKSDTGWTVNTQYQVELLLEVKRKDGTAYETKIKTLISRLQPGNYDPGSVLEVRVDPKKANRVAIVGIASAEQEDEKPDQQSSRPKRTRNKNTARDKKRTPHEQQQEDQA